MEQNDLQGRILSLNVCCICPEADSGTCKVPNNFHMQRSSTCTAIFWDKWTLKLLTTYSHCVLVPQLLLRCLCKNPTYSLGGICLKRSVYFWWNHVYCIYNEPLGVRTRLTYVTSRYESNWHSNYEKQHKLKYLSFVKFKALMPKKQMH